jgi:hypothetical protein
VTAARPWIAVLTVTALALAACGTSSPSEVRAAAVYDAIVRWFAERHVDDPDPLPVFVEPRGEGANIDLAVQAEVIDLTSEYATARFIDSREEAVAEEKDDDTGEGRMTVRDDGVLIRLDPVLEQGRRVTVDVDEYVDETMQRTLRFTLDPAEGESWRVVGEPVEVPPT